MNLSVNPGAGRAWVLNLDAESELETRGAYSPSTRMRAIVARQSARLVGTLVAQKDVVVVPGAPPDPRAAGRVGHAWCMTARARAALVAADAKPVAAPKMDVLRAVNQRTFAARVRSEFLRQEPSGFASAGAFEKHVASDMETALALLARATASPWLVRRAFGAAGRGRRLIAGGAPTKSERAWLVAGLRSGPLVIEPFVEVTREFTRNALVRCDGSVLTLAPGVQETTSAGAWIRTRAYTPGALSRIEDDALDAAVHAAGSALARAGFFGPFGIDAFRYLDGGREVLNPLSEINARWTMDWR